MLRSLFFKNNQQNMFGFKNKFGISFSWKRLFGISGFRSSFAQKTGIPTTKGGVERKLGSWLLNSIFGKREK
jgi:hypothetical protein